MNGNTFYQMSPDLRNSARKSEGLEIITSDKIRNKRMTEIVPKMKINITTPKQAHYTTLNDQKLNEKTAEEDLRPI